MNTFVSEGIASIAIVARLILFKLLNKWGKKDGDNSDGTCPNYSGTSPQKTFGTFGEGERFKNKLAVDKPSVDHV